MNSAGHATESGAGVSALLTADEVSSLITATGIKPGLGSPLTPFASAPAPGPAPLLQPAWHAAVGVLAQPDHCVRVLKSTPELRRSIVAYRTAGSDWVGFCKEGDFIAIESNLTSALLARAAATEIPDGDGIEELPELSRAGLSAFVALAELERGGTAATPIQLRDMLANAPLSSIAGRLIDLLPAAASPHPRLVEQGLRELDALHLVDTTDGRLAASHLVQRFASQSDPDRTSMVQLVGSDDQGPLAGHIVCITGPPSLADAATWRIEVEAMLREPRIRIASVTGGRLLREVFSLLESTRPQPATRNHPADG